MRCQCTRRRRKWRKTNGIVVLVLCSFAVYMVVMNEMRNLLQYSLFEWHSENNLDSPFLSSPPLSTTANHSIGDDTIRNSITTSSMTFKKSSSQGSTDTNKDGYRPLLILHIGPHKTATSAIQCHLSHHRDLMKEKASFVYIGRLYDDCIPVDEIREGDPKLFDPRVLIGCISKSTRAAPCNESQLWEEMNNILRDHSQRKDNIFISDEAFSRLRGEHDRSLKLLHSLLTKFYNVRIVIGYRRYHEWVISSHNHYLAKRLWRGKWPTHYSVRHGLQKGFSSDYSYFKTRHPTDYLRSMYESVFDDVVVFDMHDIEHGENQSLMERFFLHSGLLNDDTKLAGMKEILLSMKYYKPKNSNRGKERQAINLMAVTVMTNHWNLIQNPPNTKHERLETANAIHLAMQNKSHPNGIALNPPLDCLSKQEEENFLNKSLSFERSLFPEKSENIMQKRELEHRAKFYRSKHCSIDVNKLMADKDWLQFFQTL